MTKHGIVISDQRSARLFVRASEPGGRWRLEERARLHNRHEGEHEHHRPDLLGRGAPTAAAGPQRLVSEGHTREEEARRFAREVAAWLGEQRGACSLDRITLFAPPRFLGMLREEQAPRAAVEMLEGELTGVPVHELASHPEILAAFGASARSAS